MKRMWKGYQQYKNLVLVLLGLLAVSLITLPYLVLGEGSYVQVHDQLDGEVLNYIYQAKYLGQGDVIFQFMNGMDKASMLPPAPLGVLLYRLLPPFAAYGVMHWLCLVVGFLGMYNLCKRLAVRAEISFAIACLFCYIPFYPTYGLAALGQPMLVFWSLCLGEENRGLSSESTQGQALGRKKLSSISTILLAGLAIALYGACSSLTLIGYVWVMAGVFWTIYLVIAKRRKKTGFVAAFRVGGGTLVLLGVYLITNQDLLRALTGEGFTTHRQEMKLRAAEHPLASFKELLFNGGSYSPVYSTAILVAIVLLTLAVFILTIRNSRNILENPKKIAASCFHKEQVPGNGKTEAPEKNAPMKSLKVAWVLVGLIICTALLAVLWNSNLIVSLRLSIGGMLTYFQADRIYWCFPFLWMLVLGMLLESICRVGEYPWEKCRNIIGETSDMQGQGKHEKSTAVGGGVDRTDVNEPHHREDSRRATGSRFLWKHVIPVLCCLLLLGIEGLQILRDSPLNKNIRLMLFKDYKQITWESIYMDDVFARIDQVIGNDKDHYSVVSLGIYPSVALYHGYTCADGYSNNYDLAYKHRFRQIMARELEESPESLHYFDEWGNRLYLTGAPYGINGMVPKAQPPYFDLDYDLDAMQALNIRYLLSAAPVELSSASLEQTNLRLELLEGSPFTDDTAYYEIWVYRITSPEEL